MILGRDFSRLRTAWGCTPVVEKQSPNSLKLIPLLAGNSAVTLGLARHPHCKIQWPYSRPAGLGCPSAAPLADCSPALQALQLQRINSHTHLRAPGADRICIAALEGGSCHNDSKLLLAWTMDKVNDTSKACQSYRMSSEPVG